jgi:hypothetical protein
MSATTPHDTDKRRYGVIEVRHLNERTFHLTINRQLWSEVEWSPSQRTWCVQDAEGRCLAHCDHIVGTNIDQRAAIALAKAMIRDGRMPTPEEAQAALKGRRSGGRKERRNRSDLCFAARNLRSGKAKSERRNNCFIRSCICPPRARGARVMATSDGQHLSLAATICARRSPDVSAVSRQGGEQTLTQRLEENVRSRFHLL